MKHGKANRFNQRAGCPHCGTGYTKMGKHWVCDFCGYEPNRPEGLPVQRTVRSTPDRPKVDGRILPIYYDGE